jgi:hypothetical protein
MQPGEDHGGREYQPGDETQTNHAHTQAQQQQARAGAEAAGQEAEHIAAEGENVRDRVRQLVVDTVQQRRLELDQLSDVTQQVLQGAAKGVDDTTKEQQDSTLRAVIDGLADAYGGAADATRQAIDDATDRGKHFAQDDLARAWRNLRALDERFLRTITDTTGAGYHALTGQAQSLIDHARSATDGIRPPVESALRAVKDHPVQLGEEAAKAGVEATKQTAGRLLNAVAGLLQGAGDALSEPSKRQKRDEEE